MKYLEAENRADVFVQHAFDEAAVDLDEIQINYATADDPRLGGTTVTAWLSAFARPSQIRASLGEDTPIFSSETNPSCGHSIHHVPVLFTHHFRQVNERTGTPAGAIRMRR